MEGSMSELPATPPPAELHEVKVRVTDQTLLGFFAHREALGFHSENAAMALGLAALAGVPAAKFFEVLAKIRAYHPAPKGKGAGKK
jgi:hypothetical protein